MAFKSSVSGSWRRWCNGFKLKVKLRKLDMGFDMVKDGKNVIKLPKSIDKNFFTVCTLSSTTWSYL